MTATMCEDTAIHYTIISADCHARGRNHEMYARVPRSRVPRRLRRRGRKAEKYKNPFRHDLQDGGASGTNWATSGASRISRDGIVGEVVFPNTVPPFFPSFVLFARPPKPEEYEHRLAGIRAPQPVARRLVRESRRAARRHRADLPQRRRRRDRRREVDQGARLARRRAHLRAIPPDVDYVSPLYDPKYDRLWKVCEDLEIPINAHGGTGAPNYGKYPVANLAVHHRGRASTRSGRSCSSSSRASSNASRRLTVRR